MSHNDPLANPMGAGLTGEARETPPEGTARVESRLGGTQGGTESAYTSTQDRLEGVREEAETLVDRASHRAREAWDETRERASELTDRAGELASRAGHEIGDALERAESRLEEQTGAVSMVREHPLLASGLAFGIGFLLAGDTGRKRSGLTGRATGQLRNALLGGVSTLLMQEVQELLDEHGGPAGLLNALTGRGSEES